MLQVPYVLLSPHRILPLPVDSLDHQLFGVPELYNLQIKFYQYCLKGTMEHIMYRWEIMAYGYSFLLVLFVHDVSIIALLIDLWDYLSLYEY